jgi:hypothetical protein
MPELNRSGYHSYTLYGGDSSYLYGLGSFTVKVVKINKYKVATEGVNIQTLPGNGSGDYIRRIWTTSVDGEIYACVRRVATNKHYLYRSTTGGATFGANAAADDGNYVLMFGDVDGTVGSQLANNFAYLPDMFIEATISAQRTLLVAEYQTNVSPNNSPVRIMKSTDGRTWTQVVKFNDGRQSIRHIHTMAQDPYSGNIFIGTGDNSNECGIISWDGVGTLPDDAPANYPSYSNAHYTAIGGLQRHRPLSILFTESHVFIGADNIGATDTGIWRTNRTFSEYVRVDSGVAAFTNSEMGIGLKTSNGILLIVTYQELPNTDPWWIYASGDDGATWQRVAEFQKLPSSGLASLTRIFEWKGEVHISAENQVAAGSDPCVTVACKPINTDHVGNPSVIHPAHSYIGTDGITRTEASVTSAGIHYPMQPFPSDAIRIIFNGTNYSAWIRGQEGIAPK